jgi:predicted CXXCH cytochrome family protein
LLSSIVRFVLAAALAGASAAWAAPVAATGYTGSAGCSACHPVQAELWRGSHHAQSMQPASDQTVLGDFRDIELNHHGQITRFFRRGAQFLVRTDGPDGKPHDFTIAYTFGVSPLQQYLVAMPGGRLQALGVAWDARPKAAGGQRWYHLYPDDPPKPGETIHWAGRDQNWNFMCAACHSTGVRKNYDPDSDRYATTWVEIDVACEACHGPGSAHVAWAQGERGARPPGLGLSAATLAVRGARFAFSDPAQKIAALRGKPDAGQSSSETCAPCHSRRQVLVADSSAEPDMPYLDRFLPSLIEPGSYHADGQIDGEVFEAGSFAQSAMHRAGVACLDCHEPHGLKLRAAGNGLCAQCHRSAYYDRTEHHHHAAGSAGAQCVSCHMPTRTYMGVHARHDHSLRIPDPGLSRGLGTPDACTRCHGDKSATWAAAAVAQWTGMTSHGNADFAGAVDAAWRGHRQADRLLAALPTASSGVAQASVLSILPAAESSQWLQAVTAAAQSPDGLVRVGAARALDGATSAAALRIGVSLLDDPLRAVRIEAARALAGTPAARLTPAQGVRLQSVTEELIQAELASADRPEAHVNLAMIRLRLGQREAAEQALRTALRLDPGFVPALVNLADLCRIENRDAEGEPLLRRAVTLADAAAEPAHALGLLLVRRGRRDEALLWLRKAVELAPNRGRYAYALHLAEHESERSSDGEPVALPLERRRPR